MQLHVHGHTCVHIQKSLTHHFLTRVFVSNNSNTLLHYALHSCARRRPMGDAPSLRLTQRVGRHSR